MNSATVYLGLEAAVAFSIVIVVHALRRKTSLVYSYAVLAFMRLASWAASRPRWSASDRSRSAWARMSSFRRCCSAVLALLADGRRAGRVAVVVVVVTGSLLTRGQR